MDKTDANRLCMMIFVLTASFMLVGCDQEPNLTVGVSTTLSGPAALWGESFRNGIELARQDLSKQGIVIDVVYMDDQLSPVQAVSNYNSLRTIHDADVIFTTISRVAVPLAQRAAQDNVPVFVTAVTAPNITQDYSNVYRFFPQAPSYVHPHMDSLATQHVESIAIVSVADEYGATVRKLVRKRAQREGFLVSIDEVFAPGTTDFRAILTKIQRANVSHIFFAGDPTSTVPALKQRVELGMQDISFYDASTTLLAKPVRDAAGSAVEQAYTIALPSSLPEHGSLFSQRYEQVYGEYPFYTAHFGYDMVLYLANVTRGKRVSSDKIIQLSDAKKSFDTLNGFVEITQRGEINTRTLSVQVVNNTLTRY